MPCDFGVVWPADDHEKPGIAVLQDICCRLRDQGLPAGTMQTPAAPETERSTGVAGTVGVPSG